MTDLISRAEAIEAIPDTRADMFENCRNCKLLDREQVVDILSALPSAERNCFTCGMENGVMKFNPENVSDEVIKANDRIVKLSDICKFIKANFELNPKQWGELRTFPSAEAVQGEWIEVEDYNGDVHYKCDRCGEEWTFPYGTPKENNANFCPNCGARMLREDGEA